MLGIPSPWLILGVVLAIGGAFGGGYLKGGGDARARCNEAALRAEIAAVRVDLRAAEAAATVAEAAQRTLTAEAEAAQRSIADYVKALQSHPACAISDADVAFNRSLHVKSGTP